MTGTVLGNYEILDQLGEGGMGARSGDLLLSTGSVQLGIMGEAPGGASERDLSCLDSGESGGEKGSVYLRKTDGSPAIRVGDGHIYRLSPDGNRKQVLAPGPQGGWFVHPLNGGPAPEVRGIAATEAVIGWRQDNRPFYIRPGSESSDSIPVSIVDIASGQGSPWKTIHLLQPVLEIHDLHVTPDGRAYAYNYVTAQSDLYVAHGLN